jgi:hypothetical protein
MARILHLCGWFDPAGDVYRCVQELKKFSVHEHDLMVRYRHPYQDVMKLPEPAQFDWDYDKARFAAADAIVVHFVGWPQGWPEPPAGKPLAFRNANIRYSADKAMFWCEPQYMAQDVERYSLCASSHVGAEEFFPGKEFRWLPDMIDIFAPELTPDYSERAPCLSYIKHAEALDFCDIGNVNKQNLLNQAHAKVLDRRRRLASVVVDNLCDGHWGLAGQEAIALGLPTLVFNQEKTRKALRDYVGVVDGMNDRLDHPSLPFGEMVNFVPMRHVGRASEMEEVLATMYALHSWSSDKYQCLRHDIRAWSERHFAAQRLVERFWEPFFEELLAKKRVESAVVA